MPKYKNSDLTPTGEQFPPEFGITVHGRTPDGKLVVDLPKPRITGNLDLFKKHVAERMHEERSKADEKDNDQ
jgi:hypothetical protein